MTLRLTKEFRFEMAHALSAYNGKCRNIHGHSYMLRVTVEGVGSDAVGDNGLVIDFHELKQIVEQHIVEPFDHALVLPDDGSYAIEGAAKLILTPFQPTTENLLLHFKTLLTPHLPPQVRLCTLRLAETESSYAELIV